MVSSVDYMIALAKEKHRFQMYGDRPYFYHIYNVVKMFDEIMAHNLSDEEYVKGVIVVYGHDLIEDTDVTEELLLSEGFSEDVVEAISLVSKKKGQPYLEYISAIGKNKLAWCVKVADTHSNLTESVKDCNYKRIKKYTEQLRLLFVWRDYE